MATELHPCKKCGERPQLIHGYNGSVNSGAFQCINKCCEPVRGLTLTDGIDKWNKAQESGNDRQG